MNSSPGDCWTPSPELLAAFADGELEARPHLAGLRRRIEVWLALHPEAAADLEGQMELTRLMAATAPPEPLPLAWAKVWSGIRRQPPTSGSRWKIAMAIAGVLTASAAAVVAAVLLRPAPGPTSDTPAPVPPSPPPLVAKKVEPQPKAVEVLEVVTADEVEIVRVAGADTPLLPIGVPPLVSPIVLLEAHEVDVRAPPDNPARTEVRSGTAPVVWTPLANEKDEEDNR